MNILHRSIICLFSNQTFNDKLFLVQLLRANGCHVIGIDINHARLKLALEFGAEVIHGTECTDVAAKVASLTGMRGADAVLITASTKSDAIISQSAKMCRKRGRIVLIGVVGLNISRSDFYEKEISFRVSCSYGRGSSLKSLPGSARNS